MFAENKCPTKTNSIMWNKTNMKPVSETVLNTINPKFDTVHVTNFIVVKSNFNCLLVLFSIQQLSLITVYDNCLLPILILLLIWVM